MEITVKNGSRNFQPAMVILLLPVLVFVFMSWAGIRAYTVLSGSMEPVISTGTLLFVEPADPEMLKPYDVITFSLDDDLTATHRIISIHEDTEGLWFRTKGDANAAMDGKPVHESQIIGRPIASIPGGGYLIWYLQKHFAAVFLVLFGTAGLVFLILPGIGVKKNKKETYLIR